MVQRHWTLDLIHLHSVINRPSSSSASASASASATATATATAPLRLLLHLHNPPTDKLNMSNTHEQCRTQWVNQVKEADFVRWRNTSKSTGMRKAESDAGWDGVVNGGSLILALVRGHRPPAREKQELMTRR